MSSYAGFVRAARLQPPFSAKMRKAGYCKGRAMMLRKPELIRHIETFALSITGQPLRLARHRPEAWGQLRTCFDNVRRKVEGAGGSALFGWMFLYRRVVELSGPGYLIAVNHAVWRAPDGELIDVTPFHADPNHHPVGPSRDVVFFLTDAAAAPVIAALPSRFYALSRDEAMARHVQRLREEEEGIYRRAVSGNEASSSSEGGSTCYQ
jgi:hypothetical protein